MKGFTLIPDEFLDIDLTMREMTCLSIIYGFSQDGHSWCRGGNGYLAKKCRCTAPTIIATLTHLQELGLIVKEVEVGGTAHYKVTTFVHRIMGSEEIVAEQEQREQVENLIGGVLKNLTPPIKEFNTEITGNINILSNNRERGIKFSKPTPQDVEVYCKEQGLSIDARTFCDYYESKGWKVGSSPMKDWKAAARNWARRERRGRGNTESVFEHNMRVVQELQLE